MVWSLELLHPLTSPTTQSLACSGYFSPSFCEYWWHKTPTLSGFANASTAGV